MAIYRYMYDMPTINASAQAATPKVQRVRRYEGAFVVETNAILSPVERSAVKTVLDSAPTILAREAPELDK